MFLLLSITVNNFLPGSLTYRRWGNHVLCPEHRDHRGRSHGGETQLEGHVLGGTRRKAREDVETMEDYGKHGDFLGISGISRDFLGFPWFSEDFLFFCDFQDFLGNFLVILWCHVEIYAVLRNNKNNSMEISLGMVIGMENRSKMRIWIWYVEKTMDGVPISLPHNLITGDGNWKWKNLSWDDLESKRTVFTHRTPGFHSSKPTKRYPPNLVYGKTLPIFPSIRPVNQPKWSKIHPDVQVSPLRVGPELDH